MLLDQNAVFSEKQAVTATAASTNVVDQGAAGNAVPGGLFAVCRTDEAFAGLTGVEGGAANGGRRSLYLRTGISFRLLSGGGPDRG